MYKGVRKRKWGKWVSEIRLPNSRERIWLGSYDTQEKAARAFDAALYCLRGKNAAFNFPDTPQTFEDTNVVVVSHHSRLSPQEIQEVAAKFANNVNDDPPQDQEPSLDLESQRSESTLFNNSVCEQVDQVQGEWDTTFWNMLDDLNGGFLCPTQAPLLFQDQIQGDDYGYYDHDAFSNHSFLWSWNF
uniref:Ethylene-responsive transcription factor ERF017 family n=2 Tax=Cajanus cajan TaxID=3821 RepID=A0A151RK12_CAJCA|nr:Ethylene-responsive transcription factor ERF017 family [Cajanus cajan]